MEWSRLLRVFQTLKVVYAIFIEPRQCGRLLEYQQSFFGRLPELVGNNTHMYGTEAL
jgi:hypothetical protein